MPEPLTKILGQLPTMKRIAARRRIEAVADHWALFLETRYGKRAKARCVQKMSYCAQQAPGLRWHVWCRVFNRLR